MQASVNDFCYLETICGCNNLYSKIWSFFKQQLTYKLGLIVYKKIIIRQIIKKKYNTSKSPKMEMIMLIAITLIFDFFTLVFMELNREYIFVVYSFTIGIIILLNTMKTRYILLAISEGRGFLFYDAVYSLLIYVILFGLPRFYEGLIYEEYYSFGVTFYYAFFPVIDWFLEQIYQTLLYYSSNGFLFLQQIDLILIGLRVGTILQFRYLDY